MSRRNDNTTLSPTGVTKPKQGPSASSTRVTSSSSSPSSNPYSKAYITRPSRGPPSSSEPEPNSTETNSIDETSSFHKPKKRKLSETTTATDTARSEESLAVQRDDDHRKPRLLTAQDAETSSQARKALQTAEYINANVLPVILRARKLPAYAILVQAVGEARMAGRAGYYYLGIRIEVLGSDGQFSLYGEPADAAAAIMAPIEPNRPSSLVNTFWAQMQIYGERNNQESWWPLEEWLTGKVRSGESTIKEFVAKCPSDIPEPFKKRFNHLKKLGPTKMFDDLAPEAPPAPIKRERNRSNASSSSSSSAAAAAITAVGEEQNMKEIESEGVEPLSSAPVDAETGNLDAMEVDPPAVATTTNAVTPAAKGTEPSHLTNPVLFEQSITDPKAELIAFWSRFIRVEQHADPDRSQAFPTLDNNFATTFLKFRERFPPRRLRHPLDHVTFVFKNLSDLHQNQIIRLAECPCSLHLQSGDNSLFNKRSLAANLPPRPSSVFDGDWMSCALDALRCPIHGSLDESPLLTPVAFDYAMAPAARVLRRSVSLALRARSSLLDYMLMLLENGAAEQHNVSAVASIAERVGSYPLALHEQMAVCIEHLMSRGQRNQANFVLELWMNEIPFANASACPSCKAHFSTSQFCWLCNISKESFEDVPAEQHTAQVHLAKVLDLVSDPATTLLRQDQLKKKP